MDHEETKQLKRIILDMTKLATNRIEQMFPDYGEHETIMLTYALFKNGCEFHEQFFADNMGIDLNDLFTEENQEFL